MAYVNNFFNLFPIIFGPFPEKEMSPFFTIFIKKYMDTIILTIKRKINQSNTVGN